MEIYIRNINDLKILIEYKEFSTEFTVYSDFGPDWIGSYSNIEFYLDNDKVVVNDFIKIIEQQIANLLSKIPKNSNENLYGEGDIKYENNKLIFEYYWQISVPFENTNKSGKSIYEFEFIIE